LLQADEAAEHVAANIEGPSEVKFEPMMCDMEALNKATFAQVPAGAGPEVP
jgi:hypothetical protein